MASAKLFISYKRSIPTDEKLAHTLRDAFAGLGHDVFIDINMTAGTDWVTEIDRRIRWCDFLIVLLSEAAAESEMVQAEVRLAHQRRRLDGRPNILPVRVNYAGGLGYELDAYLSRIQYVSWKGDRDTSKIVDALQTSITGKSADDFKSSASLDELAAAVPSNPSPESGRPRASEDPRVLLPPGGTIRLDDAFYVRRDADNHIDRIAPGNGRTLVIKAARQMGKSSLLIRYLAACKKAEKQFAFIDFQSFSEAELVNLPALLKRIAQILTRAFRVNEPVPDFPNQLDFTYFVEDKILRAIGAPIAIAMDEVDRLLGRPYQADFFSMLRYWHNERAQPMSVWENMDLAMVIATEPYLLIATADRSPFNVTPAIQLRPFEQKQLREINYAYGGPLTDNEQDQLYELLSGHPYLTRLAFYRLVSDFSFETLMADSSNADGPFGEHLRSRMFMLQQQSDLLGAMRRVISKGAELDMDTYYRLHAAGLVERKGKTTVPSNMLYARFFRRLQ
jgi:hypothetical protein